VIVSSLLDYKKLFSENGQTNKPYHSPHLFACERHVWSRSDLMKLPRVLTRGLKMKAIPRRVSDV
jgi:hypothetical protein